MALLEFPVDEVQKAIDQKLVYTDKQFYTYFFESGFRQVGRAYLTYKTMGTPLQIQPKLQSLCIEASKDENTRKSFIKNQFLKEVYDFLVIHFQEAEKELLIQDGLLKVHIGIETDDVKVAVMCLRHNNYSINNPIRLMGQTKGYLTLLERLQWKVVQASQIEWEKNGESYLQSILDKVKLCFGQS
eukprot:TRINITY_DN3144_c0_g1_i4.p1 TRINITY_DN3144_c0_g1~~TRINITY_DN3144_c0_g1_i4.p1  ORF type:complete len:186 (-),score=16.27 TRINITY_DN3144_c0_g1_i4:430-987(-)